MRQLIILTFIIFAVSCSQNKKKDTEIKHAYVPYDKPMTFLRELAYDTRISSWQERQIPESIASKTLDEIITEAKTKVINKQNPKLQIAVLEYIFTRNIRENDNTERYYSLLPTIVEGHANYDQGYVQSFYFDRLDKPMLTISDIELLKSMLAETNNGFLIVSLSAVLMGYVDREFEHKVLVKLFGLIHSKETSMLLTNPGPPDTMGVRVNVQSLLSVWRPKESAINFIKSYEIQDKETKYICVDILAKLNNKIDRLLYYQTYFNQATREGIDAHNETLKTLRKFEYLLD